MPVEDSAASVLLRDLRRAQPADATLQNLLQVMSSKLELCRRLPIFEYEAGEEGHRACAATFRELAEIEQRAFTLLAACLRGHLDESTQQRADGGLKRTGRR